MHVFRDSNATQNSPRKHTSKGRLSYAKFSICVRHHRLCWPCRSAVDDATSGSSLSDEKRKTGASEKQKIVKCDENIKHG